MKNLSGHAVRAKAGAVRGAAGSGQLGRVRLWGVGHAPVSSRDMVKGNLRRMNLALAFCG